MGLLVYASAGRIRGFPYRRPNELPPSNVSSAFPIGRLPRNVVHSQCLLGGEGAVSGCGGIVTNGGVHVLREDESVGRVKSLVERSVDI